MERIDAQQELAFIKKVIQDSRRVAVDNGIDYIVWGVLVSLGMFLTVAILLFKLEHRFGNWISLALWILVMGSGWIFSLIRHLRSSANERVRTMSGTILSMLWLACGITIMTFIFVGAPFQQINPSPAIASVLGIGFLVSGVLLDFVYFKLAAIGWWLGSLFMFYLNSPWSRPKSVPYVFDFLLFGIMMLMFQVIPAVILYRRWKKELDGEDCGPERSANAP
jgi:hypothetical protein